MSDDLVTRAHAIATAWGPLVDRHTGPARWDLRDCAAHLVTAWAHDAPASIAEMAAQAQASIAHRVRTYPAQWSGVGPADALLMALAAARVWRGERA